MLRPFLLVGIGGSGGKTLRVVRDSLLWKLQEAGWPAHEGFPKAWQFLHIDVATHPDGDDADLPPQLPVADFLGLVNPGLTYTVLDNALKASLTTAQQMEALGGWRPEQHKVAVPIDKGAGQFRALGRIVALTRLDEIKSRVDHAVDAITDVDARRQMMLLTTMLNQGKESPKVEDPVCIIVASIAGGSGAGAILDICDVLRSTGKTWLDESIAVLYAPDVFDAIPDAGRRGVRPNALASISELMAGYWTRGQQVQSGISQESALLFKAKGIETTAIIQVGPRYPLLVGARNADVAYGAQNDIYRGMGKAISAWMTKLSLQSQMGAYFSGNRQSAAAAIPDRLGLKQDHMETPFSALGFARVSLGRELFAQYAAQSLARSGVSRVLEQHLTQRVPGDDRTDEALVDDLASMVWRTFLVGSGLDERGLDKNAVLDAIRSEDDVVRMTREWAATVTGTLLQGVPPEGMSAAAWTSRIEGARQERGPELLAAIRLARQTSARSWTEQIQQHLAEYVTHAVATYGALVTIKLLRQLKDEVEAAVREFPDERQRLGLKAQQSRDEVQAQISRVGQDKIPGRADLIEPAVRRAASATYFQSEAELRSLVEVLLRDLCQGLLDPLSNAVQFGLERLQTDARPSGASPSQIDLWPQGDEVPKGLRPSKNEFLLDEPDLFPRQLSDLLIRSTDAKAPDAARAEAAIAILRNSDGLDDRGLRRNAPVMAIQQPWIPAVPELQDSLVTPTRARFLFDLTAASILKRGQDWVTNRDRALGRHVSESLRNYLESDEIGPAEREARLQRFSGQLKGAVDRAQPLVNIDPAVLVVTHDRPEVSRNIILDPIPLTEGSAAAERALEVLIASKAITVGATNLFGDPVGQTIDVFTMLAEPYEPVVFSSLMQPMANEWAEAQLDVNARQIFWRWRRARPLPETIPAAPVVRRAMVRGWFTGLALGQVKVTDPATDGRVSVWIPNENGFGGSWNDMPFPFLRPVTIDADAIGAAMESMMLALVKVYAKRSLSPLAPYRRLRDLGSSGAEAGIETYETLNSELLLWIRDGRSADGAPPPDHRIGTADSDAEVRRQLTEERISVLQKSYRGRFEEIARKGDVPSAPRDFELADDILGALEELIVALREFTRTQGGSFL